MSEQIFEQLLMRDGQSAGTGLLHVCGAVFLMWWRWRCGLAACGLSTEGDVLFDNHTRPEAVVRSFQKIGT